MVRSNSSEGAFLLLFPGICTPEPEILSIDSDIEYYDVQKGIINKFSETDLTNLNKKSKDFIRDKVEKSHLILIARNQASDTISVIRQLIESVGWNLVSDKILEVEKQDPLHHKAGSM